MSKVVDSLDDVVFCEPELNKVTISPAIPNSRRMNPIADNAAQSAEHGQQPQYLLLQQCITLIAATENQQQTCAASAPCPFV
jgi:hypothetical protein